MVIDKKQCAELILKNDNFLVISHEHPDGDTLGCAFALCEILRLLGKKRNFACADAIPKDFCYMTERFEGDKIENPYIITVDVADIKLLGALAENYGDKIDLSIDHHKSNTFYAKNCLVEDRAAACEIIYELIEYLPIEDDLYIRECIYTGISTDTGCFRYQNTTPETIRLAATLTEKLID